MTPVDSGGRWYNDPEDLPAGTAASAALASAARVVGTAQGAAFPVEGARQLVARLNITNINGGTVTPGLEVSADGTNWAPSSSWPNKSANGTHTKSFDTTGAKFARWSWTVATATVTFGVDSVQLVRGR